MPSPDTSTTTIPTADALRGAECVKYTRDSIKTLRRLLDLHASTEARVVSAADCALFMDIREGLQAMLADAIEAAGAVPQEPYIMSEQALWDDNLRRCGEQEES